MTADSPNAADPDPSGACPGGVSTPSWRGSWALRRRVAGRAPRPRQGGRAPRSGPRGRPLRGPRATRLLDAAARSPERRARLRSPRSPRSRRRRRPSMPRALPRGVWPPRPVMPRTVDATDGHASNGRRAAPALSASVRARALAAFEASRAGTLDAELALSAEEESAARDAAARETFAGARRRAGALARARAAAVLLVGGAGLALATLRRPLGRGRSRARARGRRAARRERRDRGRGPAARAGRPALHRGRRRASLAAARGRRPRRPRRGGRAPRRVRRRRVRARGVRPRARRGAGLRARPRGAAPPALGAGSGRRPLLLPGRRRPRRAPRRRARRDDRGGGDGDRAPRRRRGRPRRARAAGRGADGGDARGPGRDRGLGGGRPRERARGRRALPRPRVLRRRAAPRVARPRRLGAALADRARQVRRSAAGRAGRAARGPRARVRRGGAAGGPARPRARRVGAARVAPRRVRARGRPPRRPRRDAGPGPRRSRRGEAPVAATAPRRSPRGGRAAAGAPATAVRGAVPAGRRRGRRGGCCSRCRRAGGRRRTAARSRSVFSAKDAPVRAWFTGASFRAPAGIARPGAACRAPRSRTGRWPVSRPPSVSARGACFDGVGLRLCAVRGPGAGSPEVVMRRSTKGSSRASIRSRARGPAERRGGPARGERGIALVSVVTVLVALLIIAIPLAISMKLGRDRTETSAARNQATFEAELVADAVASWLRTTHPYYERQRGRARRRRRRRRRPRGLARRGPAARVLPRRDRRPVAGRERRSATRRSTTRAGSIWSWRVDRRERARQPDRRVALPARRPPRQRDARAGPRRVLDRRSRSRTWRPSPRRASPASAARAASSASAARRSSTRSSTRRTASPAACAATSRGSAPLQDNGPASEHKKGAVVIDYVAYKLATHLVSAKPGQAHAVRQRRGAAHDPGVGRGRRPPRRPLRGDRAVHDGRSRRETAETFLDGQLVDQPAPRRPRATSGEALIFRDAAHVTAGAPPT